MTTMRIVYKGGKGSGNFGHSGRPGKIGGSGGGGYTSRWLGKRDPETGDTITEDIYEDTRSMVAEGYGAPIELVTDRVLDKYISGGDVIPDLQGVEAAAQYGKAPAQTQSPILQDPTSTPTKPKTPSDASNLSPTEAVALVDDVKATLEKNGLVRDSPFAGGENLGLIPSNQSHSGSNYVQDTGDGLRFGVTLSGKKVGIRYNDYEDIINDETYSLHTPSNPTAPVSRLRTSIQSMGFKVRDVNFAGHQEMWDDDVHYTIDTDYGKVK